MDLWFFISFPFVTLCLHFSKDLSTEAVQFELVVLSLTSATSVSVWIAVLVACCFKEKCDLIWLFKIHLGCTFLSYRASQGSLQY